MPREQTDYFAVNTWGYLLIPAKYAHIIPELLHMDREYNSEAGKHNWKVKDTDLEFKVVPSEVVKAAFVAQKLEGK